MSLSFQCLNTAVKYQIVIHRAIGNEMLSLKCRARLVSGTHVQGPPRLQTVLDKIPHRRVGGPCIKAPRRLSMITVNLHQIN